MAGLGIGTFVIVLILVIVIHEAAHFGVARAFGIKVTEFFVGFGPKVWSTHRGETEVGVKWIPAGGYVKIAGMNPYETVSPEDLPRTFGAKPIWQRALVILAGPATHFVLAFIFFAAWLGLVGQPTERSPLLVLVPQTLEDGQSGPAFAAGIRPGDRLVGIDDLQDPTKAALVTYTQQHVGDPVTVVVDRDGERLSMVVVPVRSTVDGEEIARLGVELGEGRRDTASIVGAITGGADLVADQLVATVGGVGRIFGPAGLGRLVDLVFTDEPRQPGDAASVVGVGRVAGTIASEGNFGDILFLFGLVNVFVGFLNLLPLPPFDGGHLAVLVIEKVRGRPVDMRKVVPISAAVAAFLIVFTVAVVYVDVMKPL
ncbi:MAG TPA: M50 family metallopeptidase [Actinomycetota bacterium]|jgi:membrane-associated protease RseP (regulator of RpoE activity)